MTAEIIEFNSGCERIARAELRRFIRATALKGRRPPSWLGLPFDAEALQAEAEERAAFERLDEEEDDTDHGMNAAGPG